MKVVIAKILHVNLQEIDDSSTTDSVDAWDSLGHMKIIVALEEEFSIRFEDTQIGDMTSVSKIITAVKSKL